MKQLFNRYANFTLKNLRVFQDNRDQDLRYWQNQLFCKFLVYCLPVSLIALLPGVYMAVADDMPAIAIADVAAFAVMAIITFSPTLELRTRKLLTLCVFYSLAVFLINALGYLGPGIFYLFFITVLSALIFPIRFAYRSVLLNAAILLAFAFVIAFKLFHSSLIAEYSAGKWIAFSANLVFASIIIVVVIDKIFEGLQLTIANKSQLQERYQYIFNKSPMPMWLFDTNNYKFVDVNEAAVRNYGYSRDEFLTMTIMDIRPPESVAQTANLVNANRVSGSYYGGTWQHLKKDGGLIFVKVESNLLTLDDRKVRLVQATDITAQIEQQLALFNYHKAIEESEANLRAIFDSAIDGFVLTNAKGIIKLFNPKASASMEFNKDQMAFEIGRSIFDYVDESRMAYFKRVMQKAFNGETVDYERMFRFNENTIWIRYTVNPVREQDKIVGACITGRDITERKFYLQSLEEQNKIFREISWMQSHLVRAPLARILGLLPMLNSSLNDVDKERAVDYLSVSANELDDVVKKITEKSTLVTETYPESGDKDQLSLNN